MAMKTNITSNIKSECVITAPPDEAGLAELIPSCDLALCLPERYLDSDDSVETRRPLVDGDRGHAVRAL